jgi:hypothetical protein
MPKMQAVPRYGAAQESNLPSRVLPRLTGFEALLRKVHFGTEAGFSAPLQSFYVQGGSLRSGQFQYQVRGASFGAHGTVNASGRGYPDFIGSR